MIIIIRTLNHGLEGRNISKDIFVWHKIKENKLDKVATNGIMKMK